MGTISINSTSMFYFAVASIFILCTILKNQSLEVSSNSKITFNFSVFFNGAGNISRYLCAFRFL